MIRVAAAALIAALLAPTGARAEDDAERIRRAVAHTVSIQQPNGLFRYDFDFLAGEPTGEQNMVRQAGTLFALASYLADTNDLAVAPPIATALGALADRSLPLGTGRIQSWLERAGVFALGSWRLERALASRGWLYLKEGDGRIVRGDRGGYATAQVGGTALALTSELLYRRTTGDERFAMIRAGWLRGLLALRVPGGGVRDTPETLATGPYGDGETWLALATYHDAFPDDAEVARSLADLEDHLLEKYGASPDHSFYHWGSLSSAARLARGDAARLAAFVAAQSEFMLREVPLAEKPNATTCALIEGLGSAVAVIRAVPGREDLVARLQARVAAELAHNRTLQIQPGQRGIVLGGGGELNAPSLADSAGAFLAGRYRVYERTDLTQHCISAFLIAQRHGLSDGNPSR